MAKMLARTGVSWAQWLVLGACALAGGCANGRAPDAGQSSDGQLGTVSLQLRPVTGVTIDAVNYAVTGAPMIPGAALPSGVLPTPGTDATFRFGVQVPVGTGYTLSLTAASAETNDDVTCTGAAGPFDISADSAANITVTLTCRDKTTGQLVGHVDVETDACPRLIADFAEVIPAVQDVGKNGAVNAAAHDLDGKPVSYHWSIPPALAGVGSFSNPNAQATSFACQASSWEVPLTVTVNNGECERRLSTVLSCVSDLGRCGDGIRGLGETCDPSAAPGTFDGGPFGCPADCTYACGDGIIEAPAEECELPNGVPTGDCTGQCRVRVAACGDGFLSASELCDGDMRRPGVPLGSSCDPTTCALTDDRACGDVVIATGEECEPPNSSTCSDQCQAVSNSACVACEQAGACEALSDVCLQFTGVERTACYRVAECVRDTHCAVGANRIVGCFCGSLNALNCLEAPDSGAGAPRGACVDVIRSAMALSGREPTNLMVLTSFIDESLPAGGALARLNCDKVDPACENVCLGSVPPSPDSCPNITLNGVSSPTGSAVVGKSISLSTQLSFSGNVTYSWSVPVAFADMGSFSSTTTQHTTFTCNQVSPERFRATVVVDGAGCSEQASLFIQCLAPYLPGVCGNGVVESPAEQCEPTSSEAPAPR